MDIQEADEFLFNVRNMIDALRYIDESKFDIETREMGEKNIVEGDRLIVQCDELEDERQPWRPPPSDQNQTETIPFDEQYKRDELTRPLHELIEQLTFIEGALTNKLEEFKKKGWI